MICAPNEVSDQPGHPPSLNKVFAVRMEKPWVLSYPLSGQRRLWSDGRGCTGWSESSLADQTGQMPRLIWVFAGRTGHFIGFVVRRLKWQEESIDLPWCTVLFHAILCMAIDCYVFNWITFPWKLKQTYLYLHVTLFSKYDVSAWIEEALYFSVSTRDSFSSIPLNKQSVANICVIPWRYCFVRADVTMAFPLKPLERSIYILLTETWLRHSNASFRI